MPAQLVARLKDWHTQSFVAVEGDSRVASCAKGTRPGDPLADIIFNVAMHEALDMFVKERPKKPARLIHRRHHCLCHSQLSEAALAGGGFHAGCYAHGPGAIRTASQHGPKKDRKAGFLPVQLQLRIERIKFAARLFGKAP